MSNKNIPYPLFEKCANLEIYSDLEISPITKLRILHL